MKKETLEKITASIWVGGITGIWLIGAFGYPVVNHVLAFFMAVALAFLPFWVIGGE